MESDRSMTTTHRLSSTPETVHWGYFDAALAPVLTIRSGDEVVIETVNGAPAELAECPFDLLPEHKAIHRQCTPRLGPHIMTGPVAVEGAQPGDALEVEILDVELRTAWGFNAIKPLRGTLPEDFPFLRVLHIPIDREVNEAILPFGPRIPVRPFFGIMGVAPPASWGAISSIEPREHGGNIDLTELVPGSRLFLPVFAPGALFSVGDGHAVQGDGEVCLTAVETHLTGRFRLILHRGWLLRRPLAVTATHVITMGMDPDLDDAAKIALREMIDLLVQTNNWSPADAYTFCSLACDLRITQLVDGNKGVHAMVARRFVPELRAGK
jgi:acetamidase/formamidase